MPVVFYHSVIHGLGFFWRENMLGYLSVPSSEQFFRERSSRKTVSYEEQIISKDKYPSIFSPQMESIVFIILEIFFATRVVLKIGEYLNNIEELSRNYPLIVAHGNVMFLKQIFAREAKLRGQIC